MKLLATCLFVVSLAAAPIHALGPNLLVDPGFNSNDPSSLAWQLAQGDGFSLIANLLTPGVDDAPTDYSLSALVEFDQPAATYIIASQCVEMVQAGQGYTFRAYSRNVESFGAGFGQIAVTWHDQPGCVGDLATEVRQDDQTGQWTLLEATTTAPPAAKSATVALRINKVAGEGSDAVLTYFDSTFFGLTSACAGDGGSICIQDRFRVSLTYDTVLGGGGAGTGTGLDLTPLGIDQGALFWIFDPTNPEVLVKVLDACGFTGTYWIFVSAGTNVGFELEIIDTEQELEWSTVNPDQVPFESVQDLSGFPCS